MPTTLLVAPPDLETQRQVCNYLFLHFSNFIRTYQFLFEMETLLECTISDSNPRKYLRMYKKKINFMYNSEKV